MILKNRLLKPIVFRSLRQVEVESLSNKKSTFKFTSFRLAVLADVTNCPVHLISWKAVMAALHLTRAFTRWLEAAPL